MAEADGERLGFYEEDCSSVVDGKQVKNGKSATGSRLHQSPKQPQLRCPECGSSKIWKAGVRRTNHGLVQRLLCRRCGYRFSESLNRDLNPGLQKPLQKSSDWSLNRAGNIHSNRQVCAALTRGAKNLATVESRKEKAAGATKPDPKTTKGLVVKFMAYLEREAYKGTEYFALIRRLANLGANLLDPEDVKRIIAEQPWKDSVKMLAVYAYDAFAKMQNISWTKPRYKPKDCLPFVPEEKELDQLIASCKSQRMATFLQTLKETFADPGEALGLRWIDIKKNVITINYPVKGHLSRQLKVSGKLIAMLNALPKTSTRIFPTSYRSMYTCFSRMRKRAAQRLQNPRLRAISFKTFRHWGGSLIAHYTHGNVLKVKKLLGHKRIESTMKYIHMMPFKDDEFDVAAATTIEEAKKIIAIGFEYITEMKGIKLFRKPKRFNV